MNRIMLESEENETATNKNQAPGTKSKAQRPNSLHLLEPIFRQYGLAL